MPHRLYDMKETTGQDQPKRRGRPPSDAPEMRVVGVNVNPAPDAQDRLRRLFTILAGVINDQPAPAIDSLSDGDAEDED